MTHTIKKLSVLNSDALPGILYPEMSDNGIKKKSPIPLLLYILIVGTNLNDIVPSCDELVKPNLESEAVKCRIEFTSNRRGQ